MQILQIDEHLVNVLVKSTRDGLAMAGLKPVPVGVGRYFHKPREVSAIVGFVGTTNGSIMLNASRDCACFMAGSMLGEKLNELIPQVLDGICEITNIIAGQTKAILSTTEHKFERISVPSVIVGTSYHITNYKGITSLSVEFELQEMPVLSQQDCLFTISMSLMKV
jgi:CheY-specific phosphatase CheX